ncbi:MAG: hypothetical protein NVSMB62_02820 [Acidobacteriaceae bacterium]
MSGTNRTLTLMLLPQSWDGHQLVANLLLLPNGDPTAPVPLLSGSELAFAAAQPKLRAALLPGLTKPAWDPSITPAMLRSMPLTLTYSSTQTAIFSALKAEYTPNVPPPRQSAGRIRKDLPQSYREATGFQTPSSDLFTAEDGFGCALAAAPPNTTPITARTIAWGEIISYALRQPLIAEAMGLMYLQVSIPLSAPQAAGGGWIWLEIDTSSPENWYSTLRTENPGAIVTYAARLPALTTQQDVFAAILFPTVPAAYDSSVLDTAQFEADVYLDGFAKIVHANQPTSSDAVTGDKARVVPGTDAGVQIGWDDEQVTTWVNRQIQIAQALIGTTPPATPIAELPFTVLGYRVDVRKEHTTDWASLCAASGTLNAAGVFTTSYNAQDSCIEPTPLQNGDPGQDFWLPQYFAQWRGRTLVVNDNYGYAFSGGQPPASTPASSDFNGTTTESLSGVDLRYGETYQFRTRLADLTGGGPSATDHEPPDAGITTLPFRRYVPPKKVPFTLGVVDVAGDQPLTVDRPSINYPEMVFAHAADQSTLDALLAKAPPQPPVGVPPDPTAPPFQAAVLDPDVKRLEIIVEVQAPVGDTGNQCSLADAGAPPNPGDLDGVFRVVYTWRIDFDPLATPVSLDAATPIKLTLRPTRMAHIDSPTLPSAASPTVLPIPTGRDVRLRLRGVGDTDANNLYFGSSAARTGLIADLRLRYEASSEENLLLPGNLDQQLQAFYLRNLDQSNQQAIVLNALGTALSSSTLLFTSQDFKNLAATLAPPASTPLEMLASALDLPLSGETLSAPPGKRILFGAQSTLRHTLTQDRSTITFATQKDLVHHWVVVHRVTLDRDWTWSGLAQNGPGEIAFTFLGADFPSGKSTPPLSELGKIELPGVVSALATRQSGSPGQRDQTELIFFSTLDSTVGVDDFPSPTSGSYQLNATLTGNRTSAIKLWSGDITVPITDTPRQVPQLVSAGIAESPYEAAQDYSSTTQRQRALWFEFDAPPDDPNDAFFIRVMNYGPDPLLISRPQDLPAAADTPLPLDPEPIRRIVHDTVPDDAGLAAMVELKPSATSPLHYLIPLPASISPSALDLFGFWTYELRFGHKLWSTAQGRFGRSFRVAGVQHPCPPLTANVERVLAVPSGGGAKQPCIVASADLAQTVLSGQSLTSRSAPQTQIWFLLYAQLRRADGKAYRNLLLDKRMGYPDSRENSGHVTGIPQQQNLTVHAAFSQKAVDDILALLRLPFNTPLSVLAVELFNREDLVIRGDYTSANNSILLKGVQPQAVLSGSPSSAQSDSSAVATMDQPPIAAPAATAQQPVGYLDPLGQHLGSQRILRTSPLAPVRNIC